VKNKGSNWDMIKKYMKKKNFEYTDDEVEHVMYAKTGAAVEFVEKMYTFLTEKKMYVKLITNCQ
jgi:hypothetical protein